MQAWTQNSFDAVSRFDPTIQERVVWLTSDYQGSEQLKSSASRSFGSRLGRSAIRLGRVSAILSAGCLAVGLSPGSALAPVGPAYAAIVRVVEAPLSTDILPVPMVAAPLFESDLQAEQISGDGTDVVHFGARALPRALVDTIVRAARATSVDPTYLMALADKESSFRTGVQASTSSAKGLFQFIDRTWLDTVRSFGAKHGLDAQAAAITLVDDKPVVGDEADRTAILDLRADPYVAAVMAAEMLKRDGALIGFRIGRELTPTELYLAHFFGFEDAARFIELRQAKHPASATRAFPAAAKANAGIFFARQRRGRRSLSVPEVYARIDQMIDSRLERYQTVVSYAAAVAGA